jgi:type VI secretion system protein ImpA
MSVLNIEKLLEPIAGDKPCGENLEYDPQFAEMELLAAGKPEQQVGDTIVPAEEPDWKALGKLGVELLARAKDLRIALHVATAVVRQHGVAGVHDGLALMRGMLERYWDLVHPQLDPEDNNDPLMRMNVLTSLTSLPSLVHPGVYIKYLREAPLADSRLVGRFGLRDIEIATGELPPPENRDPNVPLPDKKLIDGAFEEMPLENLQQSADLLAATVDNINAIDKFLTEKVGAGKTISLADLQKTVANCHRRVKDALSRRQGGVPAESPGAAEGSGGSSGGMSVSVPGEIRSKADVVKVIDRICEYYERCEPSSPVPLLLRRVQRLADKSFLEIVKDLTPDALGTVQSLAGVDLSQQSQQPPSP